MELPEDVIKFEGLDSCVIGISDVWDSSGQQPTRLIYSGDQIAMLLKERDGMDIEAALDFIGSQIEGTYVGLNTPIVLWEVPDELLGGDDE